MRGALRIWPDTLVRRTIIVVTVAVVASNLVALVLFSSERLGLVTGDRIRLVAERVSAALEIVEDAAPADRRALIRTLRSPGLRLSWSPQPWVDTEKEDARARTLRRTLTSQFTVDDKPAVKLRILELGEARRWLQERRGDGAPWRGPHHRGNGMPPDAAIELLAGSVALKDGSWLNFAAVLPRLQPLWTSTFALIALLTTAAAVAASVWAVRRASQPLSTFAAAAERLGVDVDAPPIMVAGPREVRTAAQAFNEMQARLQRFVRDRTQMLAAISHDLRTPLTRMRLRAELIDVPDDRDKMIADIEEMEAMIAAALSFIRDEVTEEPQKPFDLAALLESVCSDARDGGADVQYEGPQRIPFFGRVLALKRAIANLVDNAVNYGRAARVTATERGGTIAIAVDDEGPGVPETELERVFEPFTRLERSRSRQTGGVGLGLTVVRSVIRAHGGDVTLVNRPADSSGVSGLRAIVSLPHPRPHTGTDGGVQWGDQRLTEKHVPRTRTSKP